MPLIPPLTSFNCSHETQIHSCKDVLTRVKELVDNQSSQSLAHNSGLSIQELSREDTVRDKGFCLVDITLQVQDQSGKDHCLPVIRKENFFSSISDALLESFKVQVENETDPGKMTTISLKEYLQNISQYSNHRQISGSLLAERDEKGIIHGVQTCLLPAEKEEVEFTVALFNYQFCEKNPALLIIVASSEGTSAQIVDNEKIRKGQKFDFNQVGKQFSYLAQKKEELSSEQEMERKKLLIVQIPLQVETPAFDPSYADCVQTGGIVFGIDRGIAGLGLDNEQNGAEEAHREILDSHGSNVKRDPQLPIQVTTQFYKVTTEGTITQQDMEIIARQMKEEEDRSAIPKDKSSLAVEDNCLLTELIKL